MLQPTPSDPTPLVDLLRSVRSRDEDGCTVVYLKLMPGIARGARSLRLRASSSGWRHPGSRRAHSRAPRIPRGARGDERQAAAGQSLRAGLPAILCAGAWRGRAAVIVEQFQEECALSREDAETQIRNPKSRWPHKERPWLFAAGIGPGGVRHRRLARLRDTRAPKRPPPRRAVVQTASVTSANRLIRTLWTPSPVAL